MKKTVLTAFLLGSSLIFFGQDKLLSGLWMGNISNDSNTVRKDESFEIALAEYKGKVYGYSRSTFMVNDTLYYIVKRVKGTIEGDVCEVKDDKIISNNFPRGKADKGVKVTSTFRRNENDSTWYLDGDWKTNKTKKFYSITGTVALKEEKDYTLSKLFPHLEELQLDREMPFYAEARQNAVPVMAKTIIKPTTQKGLENTTAVTAPSGMVKTSTIAVDKEILYAEEKKQTDIKAEQQNTIASNSKNQPATGIKTNTIAIDKEILYAEEKVSSSVKTEKQNTSSTVAVKPNSTVKTNTIAVNKEILVAEEKVVSSVKTEKQNTATAIAAKPNSNIKTNTVAVNKEILYAEEKKQTDIKAETQQTIASANMKPSFSGNPATINTNPVITPVNRPVANPGDAAVYAGDRALATSQTVEFKSDSLELILYDNGEVDGDTVSVLMNGEIIIAKQMLRTTATRKTIYTTGNDEISLILYAENLGRYPPNTGLLVIYDGEERYQVRFTADLKQNAGIILRRKK